MNSRFAFSTSSCVMVTSPLRFWKSKVRNLEWFTTSVSVGTFFLFTGTLVSFLNERFITEEPLWNVQSIQEDEVVHVIQRWISHEGILHRQQPETCDLGQLDG